MYPLLACSLIALTVIIERSWFWLRLERKRDRKRMDEILDLAAQGDWEASQRMSRGSGDYVIRVLVVGILHRNYAPAKAMEAEAASQVRRMQRYMPVLDTIITVAPLLGIFGTVLGIISSFKMLGSSGVADPRLVTSGIAQALITTAAGLGIAIMALVPYNAFNSRIDHAVHVMEKYGTSLEVVLEKLGGGEEPCG